MGEPGASPLTKSWAGQSWLGEAVCLGHRGELSLKSNFLASFLRKWRKDFSAYGGLAPIRGYPR